MPSRSSRTCSTRRATYLEASRAHPPVLAHGLPAARLQGLLNHLEVHKHERDERAVLDVLAVLEGHVTRDESRGWWRSLLDRLECWIRSVPTWRIATFWRYALKGLGPCPMDPLPYDGV